MDAPTDETPRPRFQFPRWSNKAFMAINLVANLALVGVVAGVWYWGTAKYLQVGYEPEQPVPYSHKLHAGDLGIDCRYCHSTVEKAAFAAVPPTQTCMNCHKKIRTDSEKLLPIRESFASGNPVPWVRIHKLPDYVYFNHSAHLAAGVGCSTCHGRIDEMPRVHQAMPLTMGWCLDCHRNPAGKIRPASEITNMAWKAPEGAENATGPVVAATGRVVNPPTHCSGCHR